MKTVKQGGLTSFNENHSTYNNNIVSENLRLLILLLLVYYRVKTMNCILIKH